MLVFLIATALVLTPTLARPQDGAPAAAQASPQQGESTPIAIVSQSSDTKDDGGFSYSFETGNGIKVEESGSIKQGAPGVQGRSSAGAEGEDDSNNTILVLQGSYSYTAPDGQQISLKYIADENGFQPEGAHIPTAPPALGGAPQPAGQLQQAQTQQHQQIAQPQQPLQTQQQQHPQEPEPQQPQAPQAAEESQPTTESQAQ